jgi:hypothetical protein
MFVDDRIVHKEKPKYSIKKPLELIIKFSKIADTKPVAFYIPIMHFLKNKLRQQSHNS